MPLLLLLGIIVAVIAFAIFKVNKVQSDRFIEMAKNDDAADDTDKTDD